MFAYAVIGPRAIVDVGLRQKLPKPRDIAKIVVFGGFNLNPVIPKSISSISKLVKWLTNSTKVSTILTCTRSILCTSIPSISPVQSQLIPATVGRVNCSKRITFRGLFSMVEETVVLEAQGAQIRIFKQLNPTP